MSRLRNFAIILAPPWTLLWASYGLDRIARSAGTLFVAIPALILSFASILAALAFCVWLLWTVSRTAGTE